jgi:hypothetical protein
MIGRYLYDADPERGSEDAERGERYYGIEAVWEYDPSTVEILAKWIENETTLSSSNAWEVAELLFNKTDIDVNWIEDNVENLQEYLDELAEEDYQRRENGD